MASGAGSDTMGRVAPPLNGLVYTPGLLPPCVQYTLVESTAICSTSPEPVAICDGTQSEPAQVLPWQLWPHEPQFEGSVAVTTHWFEQLVAPGQMHRPPTHVPLIPQTLPHTPQLSGSIWMFVHAPLQKFTQASTGASDGASARPSAIASAGASTVASSVPSGAASARASDGPSCVTSPVASCVPEDEVDDDAEDPDPEDDVVVSYA